MATKKAEKSDKPAKTEKTEKTEKKKAAPAAESTKTKAAAPVAAKAPTAATAPTAKEASEELHHAPVERATPEHPFDDALLDVSGDAAFERLAKVPPARHEALVQAWVARRNAGAVDAIARREDAPS